MVRLALDGTAEPVSQDKILRRVQGQGNIHFSYSADLTTSRTGNLIRSIHSLLYVMTIHTYIHRQYFQHAHSIPIVGMGKKGAY